MSATTVRPTSGSGYGPAPERTIEQRLLALDRANDVRLKRAALKREIKAGRVEVLDVLDDPPEYVLTMKILELLMATPRVGRTKSLSLLKQCYVSPVKTVAGLSPRQRGEITKAWIWRRQ